MKYSLLKLQLETYPIGDNYQIFLAFRSFTSEKNEERSAHLFKMLPSVNANARYKFVHEKPQALSVQGQRVHYNTSHEKV